MKNLSGIPPLEMRKPKPRGDTTCPELRNVRFQKDLPCGSRLPTPEVASLCCVFRGIRGTYFEPDLTVKNAKQTQGFFLFAQFAFNLTPTLKQAHSCRKTLQQIQPLEVSLRVYKDSELLTVSVTFAHFLGMWRPHPS